VTGVDRPARQPASTRRGEATPVQAQTDPRGRRASDGPIRARRSGSGARGVVTCHYSCSRCEPVLELVAGDAVAESDGGELAAADPAIDRHEAEVDESEVSAA